MLDDVEFRAEVGGVVGRADERAGGDVAEAFVEGDLFVFVELFRGDEFDDGQVFGCRPEVLAEGEHGDVVGAEVVECLDDFLAAFAEAEHESAFGGDDSVDHGFGFFEHGEGALVLGAGADERGEALDGFDVVVEDVRAGVHAELEGPVAVVEVGDEDFDDDVRVGGADGFDGEFEVFGSAVTEVVAGDGGDDDVAEFHAGGGLCDALGFVGLERVGFGGFDGAESAGAGAFFTGDHEGCGAVAPAFPAVRALGFLADGDEVEVLDEGFGSPELRVIGEADFDPVRLFALVKGGIHVVFRAAAAHNGGTLRPDGRSGKWKLAGGLALARGAAGCRDAIIPRDESFGGALGLIRRRREVPESHWSMVLQRCPAGGWPAGGCGFSLSRERPGVWRRMRSTSRGR